MYHPAKLMWKGEVYNNTSDAPQETAYSLKPLRRSTGRRPIEQMAAMRTTCRYPGNGPEMTTRAAVGERRA